MPSSDGTRERYLPCMGWETFVDPKHPGQLLLREAVLAGGKQITVSESHKRDPKTGHYYAGGPFFTSRVSYDFSPSHIEKAYHRAQDRFYSGPIWPGFPTSTEMANIGFQNSSLKYGSKNEESMKVDGTNAISYCNPVNPASNLGTTMAEMTREGLPSIPGVQSWKRRTEVAKAAGSEYLNYVFGWAPLIDEVSSVRDAARHHRDIMNQYHHGEGRNTLRRFDYPAKRTTGTLPAVTELPIGPGISENYWDTSGGKSPKRTVSLVRETKRWFEGSFTYALPSSTDSWQRMLGFGSQADQLFGIALSPDVLWELTPWSWAVDWFSNAGEVVNNVTNFGLAGLVLRYGYQMEESIEKVTAELTSGTLYSTDKSKVQDLRTSSGACSSTIECVTKRRVPASPFGFSIGWEGLSPTQLAITAALGITRLL